MSKFERYKKKKSELYIFPHKHCKRCGQMISESINYCETCHKAMKNKKKKHKKRKS